MTERTLIEKEICYHCGDERHADEYQIDDKHFCCQGCQTVYQVLAQNQLCSYYNFNAHPGETRKRTDKRFEHLSDPTVIKDLIDYTDDNLTIVSFYIPHIHCSSCLWLLEQLNKLNPAIQYCRVDFLKKQLNVRFDHNKLSLQGWSSCLRYRLRTADQFTGCH